MGPLALPIEEEDPTGTPGPAPPTPDPEPAPDDPELPPAGAPVNGRDGSTPPAPLLPPLAPPGPPPPPLATPAPLEDPLDIISVPVLLVRSM
jgi:hypothetical protein